MVKNNMNYFDKYKSCPLAPNWHDWFEGNIISSMDEFNDILSTIYSLSIEEVSLTKNGHFSKRIYSNGYAWSKTPSTNTFELILHYAGRIYKFIFWPCRYDEKGGKKTRVSGREALNKFRREAGSLATEFALTDNNLIAEVKEKIEKPKIELTNVTKMLGNHTFVSDDEWTIFHMDIHSAYPAGVANTTPALKEYMEKLYKLKESGDPDAKLLLNAGIGAMQSLKLTGRRYPELSRRGIEWTNRELERMTATLESLGCCILAYNTDGIWVASLNGLPKLDCIGPELGQWDIDHVVEKLRFKSAGAYEYIENGQYKAVLRGRTRLDSIKPREAWEWGDIFNLNAAPIQYTYDITTGLIKEVEVDG